MARESAAHCWPSGHLVATPLACPPLPCAVLRRKNSYNKSLWMLPLFTFITVCIG